VPTLLFGLPTHVLVVHAVVVLVPLAVLASIVVAVWPASRRRYGWPTVVLTAVATATIPIATSAGEDLEHVLPRTPAIEAHTHLGDELLPFALPMLVLVVGLMLFDRYQRANRPERREIAADSPPGTAATVVTTPWATRLIGVGLAVVTVAFAVVTAVQVVRIGDSGARAVWGAQTYVQQSRRG